MVEPLQHADVDTHSEGVRHLIHATMDGMSNGERKVARALLANYPSAGLTTVAELASIAGVSAPTVIRCVNKLGFTGFPPLQRALVQELNELGSPLRQYSQKHTGSSEENVLRSTGNSYTAMMQATYQEIPESEFRALVSLLSDRTKRIRVSGGRFSRFLAEYVVVHLRLLRSDVQFVSSEDMDQRAAITEADSSTVFLVFDYRRYTAQSRILAERMHQRGATVCLMTDNWLSPISAMSRIVLPSHVDSASPFDSIVAATAVAESVIAGVADHLGEAGLERLAQAEESLEDP